MYESHDITLDKKNQYCMFCSSVHFLRVNLSQNISTMIEKSVPPSSCYWNFQNLWQNGKHPRVWLRAVWHQNSANMEFPEISVQWFAFSKGNISWQKLSKEISIPFASVLKKQNFLLNGKGPLCHIKLNLILFNHIHKPVMKEHFFVMFRCFQETKVFLEGSNKSLMNEQHNTWDSGLDTGFQWWWLKIQIAQGGHL